MHQQVQQSNFHLHKWQQIQLRQSPNQSVIAKSLKSLLLSKEWSLMQHQLRLVQQPPFQQRHKRLQDSKAIRLYKASANCERLSEAEISLLILRRRMQELTSRCDQALADSRRLYSLTLAALIRSVQLLT